MLRDHLRIAFRRLRRQKGYVFLNVGGLAVALASCAMILLFVRDELSYDRFHPEADAILALNARYQFNESTTFSISGMPTAMAQALKDEIAGIENAVRWDGASLSFLGYEELDRTEYVYLTDPAFFDVFNFPLVRGNPDTALDDPSSLILTPEVAARYFGTDDPIGQTLTTEEGDAYVVTGIIEPPPHNTEFSFSLIARYPTVSPEQIAEAGSDAWSPTGQVTTYVKLAQGFSTEQFEALMPGFLELHMGSTAQNFTLLPERLVDLHLRRKVGRSASGLYGDIKYVWMFSGIAALILLIACINYTNLATARSLQRAREVGVRKADGAGRGHLVRVFLGESILMCGLATIVAVVLVDAGLPAFSRLTGKEIDVNWLSDPFLIPGFVGLTVLVSLLAGAYPAAVLSRFQPILALRGATGEGGGRAWLRKSLVTFQFVISAGLIMCTLVMLRQLNFMQSTDLGLQPDQIVSVNLSGSLYERFPVFKDAFQRVPNVVGVSGGEVVNGGFMIIFEDDAPVRPSEGVIRVYQTDHDYVDLLGMEIVAGSDFRDSFEGSERIPVLLNEAAVEDMQLTEPIGQVISWGGDADVSYEVIGVVKDFHYGSLRQEIGPLMIRQSEAPGRVLVKVSTDDVQGTLAALEAAWAGIEQEAAFNYRFLDEQFERLYDNERRTGNLFTLAAMFAIFVSCLGLFGLAAYSAEQRTREIGIRKVLGATVGGIVGLLSKEFLRLVLIAFVLAAPVAWFIMNNWLEDFAFRIEIGPGIFALSAALALVVALSSVVWQAIRSAVADPVKSIRYE